MMEFPTELIPAIEILPNDNFKTKFGVEQGDVILTIGSKKFS